MSMFSWVRELIASVRNPVTFVIDLKPEDTSFCGGRWVEVDSRERERVDTQPHKPEEKLTRETVEYNRDVRAIPDFALNLKPVKPNEVDFS